MIAYVNGVRRAYVKNSLRFKKSTNQRPDGSIQFINEGTSYVKAGSRVDIYDYNNVHVFGGYARKPKLKNYQTFVITQVDLVDNQDITDRRIVAESYVGRMDYEIIQDIHNRYLIEEGVSLGVIASNNGEIVVEEKTEKTQADFLTGVLSGLDVSTNGTVTLERVDDNPPISSIYDNFLTSDNPFEISYSGDGGNWSRVTGSGHGTGSGYVLRSPSLDHREFTEASFNVSVREGALGKLNIRYKVSSEEFNDYFNIWLVRPGVSQWERIHRDSGNNGTWEDFSYTLEEGSYTIVLEYSKDRSGSVGDDRVYIASISLEEVQGLIYNPIGYRTANKITSTKDVIKSIQLSYKGSLPTGTSISFQYSIDNGETFKDVEEDLLIKSSVNGGEGIIVQTILSTLDTSRTPELKELTYKINTTTGTFIQKAVFNYIPISQALDELAELSGATWFFTPDKQLNYVARDEFSSPWGIDENNRCFDSIEVEMNMNEYRNKQYVRAGHDTTDLQTEIFVGDGSRNTFTLGFAVAEQPTILMNNVVQTVGIRGKDRNKYAYWAKEEKEITIDDTQAKLTTSDRLTVQYKGLFPIISITEANDEIERLKTESDGTGIYETVDDNENIDDSDIALEFANSKLRRHAKINKVVKFRTIRPGLKVGQLIPINLPGYELDDNFLITTISIQPYDKDFIIYDVECVDGEDVGGWEMFFKRLAKNQKTFVIRENEILVRSTEVREKIGLGESLSYTVYECKFPSDTLFPSDTYYPC